MAVSANQLIVCQTPEYLQAVKVAAAKVLYQGTMAFFVAASGYATDVIAAGANSFAGIVKETVDNSTGADGDKSAECWQNGVFELQGSGFTQALVGDKIYASDNFTVTGTATSNTLIGRCVEFISATRIRVQIEVGVQS